MNKVINVGLLGLGTVGSGVFKTLENFPDINVSRIAVGNINKKRDISGLDNNILTVDADSIVNDESIDIVVEVIGGINPAFDLIKNALTNGKHVITANKELIAKHGKELFTIANENNVVILYEAAVAGGIPIIMPIKTALAGNRISKIAGILNGTTNFILTKMEKEGSEFSNVLKEAQDLGYAEADPTGDVQGYDAAYKIAILASIAFNKRIDVDLVHKEGIDKITPVDIEYANEFGYKIKLIALTQDNDDKIDIRVHPMLVSKKHPLAHIDDVMNAVVIESFPVGQVMFSGPGAGEFPTASSVVGDLVSLVHEMQHNDYVLPSFRCKHTENADILNISNTKNKYYISIKASNKPGVIGDLGAICGKNNINLSSIIQKGYLNEDSARIVLLTEESYEKDVNAAIADMNSTNSIKEIFNTIRVMD